jgi:hypothetical protein
LVSWDFIQENIMNLIGLSNLLCRSLHKDSKKIYLVFFEDSTNLESLNDFVNYINENGIEKDSSAKEANLAHKPKLCGLV